MITTFTLLVIALLIVWVCRQIPDHYPDPEPPSPDSPLDVRIDYWIALAELHHVTNIDEFCQQINNISERQIVRSMLRSNAHVPHDESRARR